MTYFRWGSQSVAVGRTLDKAGANTLPVMTQRMNTGWSWRLGATLAGLGAGMVGIALQYVAEPGLFGGFPPGLYFLGGAVLLVALVRRWSWAPVFGVLLAAWITFGGIRGGQLIKNLSSGNGLLVVGNVVLQLGLVLAVVAGVLAIAGNVRRARQARLSSSAA